MDQIRKALLPFSKARKEKKERFSNLCKNGGLLLEKLIASFGGRYKLPVRIFSAEALIRASSNFSDCLDHMSDYGYIHRGNLEGQPILIKFYAYSCSCDAKNESVLNSAIRDIAVNSQMSHSKNVLKLIGCSLEFEYPALVYENAGTELLSKNISGLTWRRRIKIASDIANAILYLHTAFATPIIHRDIKPSKVIIDQYGVAKLFDFAVSISLPPGELQVEDAVRGTYGYLDPQYRITGYVTQKADVYSFGMLMLALFTGETAMGRQQYDEETGERILLRDQCKGCIENDQLDKILDPAAFAGEIIDEPRQNVLAFLHLSLRCTVYEATNRPEMIEVARELLCIEKSVRHC